MPDNRQNQTNPVSNSSIDNAQERIGRMKIEKDNGYCDEKVGGGDDSSLPYTDRPGEPYCIYYIRTGLCGYGSICRFNHPSRVTKCVQSKGDLPQRVGQPDCGFYLKTGTCEYGSSCKFHHPNDRSNAVQAPLNSLGLPIRQDSKRCPYYMRNYTCKFGVVCKFSHPQPSSAETILPVPGASAYMAMNSSVYPSVGMPYSSGLSTWLLPRSPYVLDPRVPGPPTYAPIVIPSSQGLVTAQGWNTFVGTVPPPTNIYGTSFYNTKDQQGFGMNVPFNSSEKISGLPERPGQPECRYFMSTGSCKYGTECKYHHPRERIAQSPMLYSLGPHGLPLRPGESVCSHFRMCGVCRYGPTCKFDHPIASYVSQASVCMVDQPYQRNSESSPSKSSKISDWIQKPEPVDDNNDYSKDPKESANHHPPTTLQVPTDQ